MTFRDHPLYRERVRALLGEGMATYHIAERLGISRVTVRRIMEDAGWVSEDERITKDGRRKLINTWGMR